MRSDRVACEMLHPRVGYDNEKFGKPRTQKYEERGPPVADLSEFLFAEEMPQETGFQEKGKDTLKRKGVIGTHGRTGLGKLLLGSVAEEIFRTVPCPVLTVGPRASMPNGPAGKFHTILYATDFSPESLDGATYAVSLAQEFQSRLILLHVIAPQRAGDLVSSADHIATSQKLLRQTVSPEAQPWCHPEYQVVEGNSAEQILEFAKLRDADLIVLGACHEEGVPGAASHLPFATAHRVVTYATCPVLTIRH